MEDKQAIILVIDCYRIPLTVRREEEPIYRKAAQMLNEVYQKYAKRMPNKSPQELWILVALEIAVTLHKDARSKDLQPVMNKIEEINAALSEVLTAES